MSDSDSDTLPYIDKPKHQISGVWPLCKCPTKEQRPTYLAGPSRPVQEVFTTYLFYDYFFTLILDIFLTKTLTEKFDFSWTSWTDLDKYLTQ